MDPEALLPHRPTTHPPPRGRRRRQIHAAAAARLPPSAGGRARAEAVLFLSHRTRR
jgi:hypothetical protein